MGGRIKSGQGMRRMRQEAFGLVIGMFRMRHPLAFGSLP